MFRRNSFRVFLIALLAAAATWVVWPQVPSNYLPPLLPWPERGWIELQIGETSFVRKGMTLGLDLQGGTHIVLEADLSQRPAGTSEDDALEGVRHIIERRINAYGVAEPVIQTQGNNRISLQLPGVKDIDEAKGLIGRTAQLDFREQDEAALLANQQALQAWQEQINQQAQQGQEPSGDPAATPTPAPIPPLPELQPVWKKARATGNDGQEKELTGAFFLPNAQVTFNPQTGRPEVAFEFNDEGARLFEQITRRLAPLAPGQPGQPLGIFLDDQLISAPEVQAVIGKRGVISGLDLEEAQLLTIQLNAGALPVPVTVVKEQTVDATLGTDSIKRSIVAGEIGLLTVMLFMVLYYRLPGFLAAGALVVYTVLTLAIFKLIPVTLTLAGIAAFILSVGMAVDANILIFERMREELRRGRTLGAAIEEGFARAWPSIRDSNVATLITCGILYWFGNNFGASLIMGFALTLGLGVLVSMFSAITVTRSFLRIFVGTRVTRHLWLMGMG
ncbi:MAG: protein translocase subunit SecD [Chloroflexi bacterium]|nr:protein translocase subunit SecD [Chloroflexota bacterium]